MNNIRKYFFPFAVTCMLLLLMSGCKKHETYIVTFNANGGTGTMEAQTFTEGEAQALSRNAFTYDGYTFSGWNTVQGGSGASYTDQQTIIVTSSMTLYAQWTGRGSNPTPAPQRHEFVDLGLPSGTKWATCNVGANNPEEYGDYFAWGETEPKETYYPTNYIYGRAANYYVEGTLYSFIVTKYCDNPLYGDGITDNLTILEANDDVATVKWGIDWRMPTKEELWELRNNCIVTWTTQNNVNGCLFTGTNGNSIFFPATGLFDGIELRQVGSELYYWSSSLTIGNPNGAFILGAFYSSNDNNTCCYLDGAERIFGIPVRPVYVN